MSKYKPWRVDYVLNMNIHEFHMWLAEDIDREKLKAELRTPKNTTVL